MDLEMKAEEITQNDSVWDVEVRGGVVPIISGEKEETQTATLAAFLELGTIPQLPEAGVDWAGFLTGAKMFGDIDVEIREALRMAGREDYFPNYQIEGDRLTLTVAKEIAR